MNLNKHLRLAFLAISGSLLSVSGLAKNPLVGDAYVVDPSRVSLNKKPGVLEVMVDDRLIGAYLMNSEYLDRVTANQLSVAIADAKKNGKLLRLNFTVGPETREFLQLVDGVEGASDLNELRVKYRILEVERDAYKADLEKCRKEAKPLIDENSKNAAGKTDHN